jgi:L-ribulose-5-phosphate 3-epimerase
VALSQKECLEILHRCDTDSHVIVHSMAVSDFAGYLADRMTASGVDVDPQYVRAAALLHDLGKSGYSGTHFKELEHALAGGAILNKLGLAEYAGPVSRHLIDNLLADGDPLPGWADKLIWYADKVNVYRYRGLDARLHDLSVRHGLWDVVKNVSGRARELEKLLWQAAGEDVPAPDSMRRRLARKQMGVMELAVGSTYDYAVPLTQQMADMKEVGFGSVSLAGGKVAHSGFDTGDGRVALKRLSGETAVAISSVHAPFAHDMSGEDAGECEVGIRDAITGCEAAGDLGAPVVVIHPHSYMQGASPERVRRFMEALKRIEQACPAGVQIACENLPAFGTEVLLRKAFSEYPPERMGFCYDSSHHRLRPRDVDMLSEFGERLCLVHISDNQGLADDHQIPGEGVVDWTDFARKFGALAFQGPFLLEVETRLSKHKDSTGFLTAAFNAGEYLLALADRMGEV